MFAEGLHPGDVGRLNDVYDAAQTSSGEADMPALVDHRGVDAHRLRGLDRHRDEPIPLALSRHRGYVPLQPGGQRPRVLRAVGGIPRQPLLELERRQQLWIDSRLRNRLPRETGPERWFQG